MSKKLPPDVLEYFRKQGRKGGKAGGAQAYKNQPPDRIQAERSERARKAGLASGEARQAKAKRAKD